MPDSTPHIEQVRIESKTLPVRERVEQVGARGDIKSNPCGGINISLSLDRPNEEVTISAEDLRDSNADFVYKKEGGTYDKTTTYGPFLEGEEVFFVKEQNKNCIFKVTKEVIHCDITLTVDNVIDETYEDSTGEIYVSVTTVSDSVEWRFDGGAWFSGAKNQEWAGLSDGTYLVEVRDEFGCTDSVSAVVENEADTFAPSIPQNITILDRSDGEAAIISWDSSIDDETSVDHYDLYRSQTQGFTIGDSNRIGSDLTNTEFEDTNVVDGQTYYYRVTATDINDNESTGSTEKEFLFTDDVAPQAPSSLSGTVSDNTVDLDWTASSSPDVDHYNVYRDYTKIDEVAAGTTNYSNTGLTNEQSYEYVVTAVDEADNESSNSGPITKTPIDTTPPAAPTGLTSSFDQNAQEVNLSWDANTEDDFVYYKVYRSTQSGGSYNEIATNITTESYTDSIPDANTGTTYFYVVEAIDDDSLDSAYSNEVEVLTSLTENYTYNEPEDLQSQDWLNDDRVFRKVALQTDADNHLNQIEEDISISEYTSTGSIITHDISVSGRYKIEVWGGQGGGSKGANGGYTKAEFDLNDGDTLHIRVGNQGTEPPSYTFGGGGWPDGGDGVNDANNGAGGGGSSSVMLNSSTIDENDKSNVLVVAGGGGGHGGCTANQGGAGGDTSGGDGTTNWSGDATGGRGGDQSSGGLSGYNYDGVGSYSPGENGGYFSGGDASGGKTHCGTGGGGGGFYGGGAGSSKEHGAGLGASGGGGSGYVDTSSVINVVKTQGGNGSNPGKVTIE